MYKLVVLSAIFAVALARPGYLHGHDLVSISVPRASSHQSRVEIHNKPIISFNEHLHGVDLQAITLNGHHDNLEAITIDADHQDNLHEVADHYEDDVHVTYSDVAPLVHSHHVATPIVHSVDAIHSAPVLDTHYTSSLIENAEDVPQIYHQLSGDVVHSSAPVYNTLNTHYVSSPIVNSEDALQVYSVDNHHLSGDVVHSSAPVYNTLNNHYVSSPIENSEDVHQVYSVDNHHVSGDVIHGSAPLYNALNTQYVSSPLVHSDDVVHGSQYLFTPTVTSEDVHQVYSVDDHHVTGEVVHGSAPVFHALNSHDIVHAEDVHQVSPVHSVEAVVAASNVHYAEPAVVSHSSKETVSSHELHQVHGAPAVHAVAAVHLDHDGHLVPVVQAVHSAPSAVSHSSRTDVIKSSSSVLATPVAHGYAGPAVHAW